MPPKKKEANIAHLRTLVQLEKDPAPLTKEDIKARINPSSYKDYLYNIMLWIE